MRKRWAWVLALLAAAVANAAKKPVTIDDLLLEEPHHEEMTPNWAPDGMAFTYEEDGHVYLYSVVERKARRWFDVATLERMAKTPPEPKQFGWQNRRVSSNSYQWFPDSKKLLAEVDGDLFEVFPSGRYEQITATEIDEEDPKLSPDGKEILYRSDSNLNVIDIATKKTKQLTNNGTKTLLNGQLDWVYPEELDLSTATWWSPDSQKIAYLQFNVAGEFLYPQVDLLGTRAITEPERFPQAGMANALVRLGVIAASGGTTTWMDIGPTTNTLVARVVWLPDSSKLAVERLNRVQDHLDLLLCDAPTGMVHSILEEQSRTWINVSAAPAGAVGTIDYNLYFFKSRPEFLWTSERSGFRHIYRYADTGELLGQLTTGDWEVRTINAVDEEKQRVYYTSSETSALESQYYSVGLSGGERIRLTAAGATHSIHANVDGSYYVDTFSSLKHPPETVLATSERAKPITVLRPPEKKYRSYDILPTEIVQVKTLDGVVLYARLIKPAHFKEGTKYPAIVIVYGGPQAQSVKNTWDGLTWDQVLAHRGYVIWQLDNRGSYGRGHAFEAPIYRELGRQEVADQRLGVEHLLQMGFVDPNRIGITGWSYGGYMTIHCMLLAPDIFKVGVAGAPVTDFRNYDTIYTERYMGLPSQNQSGYDASSNVNKAAKLQGKLMIVHNLEDDNVLFQNTMQMVNALERADKQYVMQIYPLKTHGVTGDLRKPMYQAMTDFFDRNLKGGGSGNRFKGGPVGALQREMARIKAPVGN